MNDAPDNYGKSLNPQKVMNSWDLGDTKLGRAADMEAKQNILKILLVFVRRAP